MNKNKKWFEEPELDIVRLQIADVITTSEIVDGEEPDWGMGDF